MAKGHTRWRGRSIEVIYYDAAVGKNVSRSVRWQGTKRATQQAADKLLREKLAEVESGQTGPDITVRSLVARWRRHAEADWSPTTRAAYDSYLRNHILPALGDKKVGEVRPADLDEFYAALRANGLSAASIGKAHVIIRRAFAEAVRWRWLASNPASDARPPKITRTELSPPSTEDVLRLLELADRDLYCFLSLAADTGARRGELCALRWSNVDLEAGELVIDRAAVLDKGKVTVKDTKTHQARRVALGAPAVLALRAQKKRANEKAIAAGIRQSPHAYVFAYDIEGTKPWRPDGATSRFMTLRKKAKLPNVRLHDIRHYLVSSWLAGGVDARTVMGRVGHANLTTLTRYAHFAKANDREAAQRLGERLRDA